MPDRLEKWIYIGIATKEHTIHGEERKIGHFLGLIEADHPAGWSLESWNEEDFPHPFADYCTDEMKDNIDVFILDPESFPKDMEILNIDAIKGKINLAEKLLECLDGIEDDDTKKWDYNLSTLCKLDLENATIKSDGNLKVTTNVKKNIIKNVIVEEDVEKHKIVDGKINTNIVKREIIKKVKEKKLFKKQEVRIPKQCRFVKLKS